MRNVFVLAACAAIALTGCSAEPARSEKTAATGLLAAYASPKDGQQTIDLTPLVRLRGFACARTGDDAFHCTRE